MLNRIGISLDEELLEQFDELIAERGYNNRSEAVRDMIREELIKKEWKEADENAIQVAVAVIVYDHDSHDLSHKLTHLQHNAHDLIISTTHVHMDENNCLEVLLLKGKAKHISALGNTLTSTSGVKMGKLIPATTGERL
ncbi:MAG: nickel-responsive transcriptional regulator NikR [Deltaproteobacteria bacterium]|nr:nickel-responsive transcriptional regulator NikR [Deltaproteobacteria bacterium]MBN2670946.1 nickel-responsive transcriptional regulator NikR [Deltaproteobacteria bacterium]